jgi:hypothetical protein
LDEGDPVLLAALAKAGILKLLVPTMLSGSPFPAAAAAGALGYAAQIKGSQAAVEESGGVPALVKLIRERRLSAVLGADLSAQPAVFQRYGAGGRSSHV